MRVGIHLNVSSNISLAAKEEERSEEDTKCAARQLEEYSPFPCLRRLVDLEKKDLEGLVPDSNIPLRLVDFRKHDLEVLVARAAAKKGRNNPTRSKHTRRKLELPTLADQLQLAQSGVGGQIGVCTRGREAEMIQRSCLSVNVPNKRGLDLRYPAIVENPKTPCTPSPTTCNPSDTIPQDTEHFSNTCASDEMENKCTQENSQGSVRVANNLNGATTEDVKPTPYAPQAPAKRKPSLKNTSNYDLMVAIAAKLKNPFASSTIIRNNSSSIPQDAKSSSSTTSGVESKSSLEELVEAENNEGVTGEENLNLDSGISEAPPKRKPSLTRTSIPDSSDSRYPVVVLENLKEPCIPNTATYNSSSAILQDANPLKKLQLPSVEESAGVANSGDATEQVKPKLNSDVPLARAKRKSSLKKMSSYGLMEEIGENIPILIDKKNWQTLPAPEAKPESLVLKKPPAPKLPTGNNHQIRALLKRAAQLKRATGNSCPCLMPPNTTGTSFESTNPFPRKVLPRSSSLSELLTPSSSLPTPSLKRNTVSFSKIIVRDYNVTVGDGACRLGPPVSLDWNYEEQAPVDVFEYETNRPRRRGTAEMRMTPFQRSLVLRHKAGISISEVKKASQRAQKTFRQRQWTNSQPLPLRKVQDVLESASRKAKRLVVWPRNKTN